MSDQRVFAPGGSAAYRHTPVEKGDWTHYYFAVQKGIYYKALRPGTELSTADSFALSSALEANASRLKARQG